MFIGVDYGSKRVGIAVSDPEGRIAFPLETVSSKDALGRISALALERDGKTIVLGESKDLLGKENPLMERIQAFKEKLEEKLSIPVVYEPEFYTSAEAARQGRNKRGEKEDNEGDVDASAAALILQSYLDRSDKIKNNG